MQNYEYASGLICPDVSSLGMQIRMIGDREGTRIYSHLESVVSYCLNEEDCKELDLVQAYVNFMQIRHITSNTYYDIIANQIRSYIWYSDRLFYLYDTENWTELRVVPSLISFLNSSSVMVYETKESQTINYPRGSSDILFLSVRIDPQLYTYSEYYNYQPQFSNSRRQLESSIEVSFQSSLHCIFY